MPRVDRSKLYYGRYTTPRFTYQKRVEDARRGEVVIVGLSDAPIPWPIGKQGNARALVLYGDLVRAVRREALVAVCHWWGVGLSTVQRWRRVLGVARRNEGDKELLRRHGKAGAFRTGLSRAQAKARDPERRQKIAAAQTGRPRPPHVAKMLRTMNVGKRFSLAVRAKMSATHRKRGTWPPGAGLPWQAWEDELVRTMTPTQAAKRLKRSADTISNRRRKLGLPDGRSRAERKRLGRK